MTTQETKQIAETILKQLGGNQFVAMTGAKNFGFDANGSLSFRLPTRKINCVKITPNALDLYDIEFRKITRRKLDIDNHLVAMDGNIYADNLRGIFEKETGLRTSLTAVYC